MTKKIVNAPSDLAAAKLNSLVAVPQDLGLGLR